jgi:hypothetical protein
MAMPEQKSGNLAADEAVSPDQQDPHLADQSNRLDTELSSAMRLTASPSSGAIVR